MLKLMVSGAVFCRVPLECIIGQITTILDHIKEGFHHLYRPF